MTTLPTSGARPPAERRSGVDPGVAWSVTLHVLSFPWFLATLIALGLVVSALDVGALVIQTDEHTTRTAFHSEGFIEVRPECVYILSQACEWPEEIDEKRALEAEQRAHERLQQQHTGDDLGTMGHSKVALMRAMTRQKIKSMSSK